MTRLRIALNYMSRSFTGRRARRGPMYLLLVAGALALIAGGESPRGTFSIVSDSTAAPSYLRAEVHAVFAQMEERARKIQRAQTIANYARQYRIARSLAHDVYTAAEKARIDPELGFRVVKIESFFNENATSPVGAIGLMQVMLATAQEFDSTMTEERLYDRHVNLRIGFRYLREMIDQHDGDVMLALAAYNRGPGTVKLLLAQGHVPTNAYERVIMKGYTGRGILE